MTRSFGSRRGSRKRDTGEANKGHARSAAVKQRNARRTRAMRRGATARVLTGTDLELEYALVPAKNADEAKRGCLMCGTVYRG